MRPNTRLWGNSLRPVCFICKVHWSHTPLNRFGASVRAGEYSNELAYIMPVSGVSYSKFAIT